MLTTIRSRLIAISIAAFTVTALISASALYYISALQERLVLSTYSGLAAQNLALTDMAHDNLRGLVEMYSGAVQDADATRIAEATDALNDGAAEIVRAFHMNDNSPTLNNSSRAKIAAINPLIEDYSKSAREIAKLDAEDTTELRAQRARFTEKFKVLERELGAYNDLMEQQLVTIREESSAVVDAAYRYMALAIAVGLVLIAVSLFAFYRSLTRGLQQLGSTIDQVNSGDFSVRTNMPGDDELGSVGRSFDALLNDRLAAIEVKEKENEAINNSAIGLLRSVFTLSEKDLTVRAAVNDNIVGTIASSINQFADETANTLSSVQHIALQVDSTAQQAKQQSLAVESAVSREKELLSSMGNTLNEASRQLTEVAALSQNSETAAVRTTSAALAAQNAVTTTVRGMETLRAAMSDTEKRFKRLSGRSQEISSAVALINTISERTHVLSLNAAIQAAEAGDAGRGFAVVAQEVQRLSDTSRQATSEITSMVNNIQAETNETLFTLNRLIADVVEQTDLAQGAESEMDKAQSATDELVALVRRIGSSSHLQQTLAKVLRENIESINDSTAQTSSAISEQNQSTTTLVQYSLQLRQSISQFKLEAQSPALKAA